MNIVLSCAGKQLPLVNAFKKALNNNGNIIVMDINKYAPALQNADISIISPTINDPNYKDWCLKMAQENEVSIWISLFEDELILLEDIRNELLESGCLLIGAPKSNILNALNKESYEAFLKPFNILVPKTYTLNELSNEENSLKEAQYIVKQRKGRGSRGLIKVENIKQLFEVGKERNFSSDWIAQEYINGDIFCIDIINDLERNFKSCLIRKRLSMGSQETDVAITTTDEPITKVAQKLSEAIKHQGCMDVDIVRQGDLLYVIDINVRFGGSHIFSMNAGANIPAAIIAWRKNEKAKPDWLTHQNNIAFSRYTMVTELKDEFNNSY